MSTGKVVLSVVAGVAAGAVLDILYAPDKGINTRKKISQKGEELRDGIKDRFTRIGDFIGEKFDNAKEYATHIHENKKETKSAMS